MVKCKLNNKMYIGQTIQGATKRFRQHARPHIRSLLSKAIQENGFVNFETTVLMVCDKKNLDLEEAYYIEHYDTLCPNGYNISAGNNLVDHYNTLEEYKKNRTTKIIQKVEALPNKEQMQLKKLVDEELEFFVETVDYQTRADCMKTIRENHPDKNPDGNEEELRMAIESLKKMPKNVTIGGVVN